MKHHVLVIDVGGTHVKVLATGQQMHRKFASGPALTPKEMVAGVRKLVPDWKYDVISIGYPGPVSRGQPALEPKNLGKGWVGFNFRAAFKRPVQVMNDASMQALGSYKRGKMLFLGLGTGLGSALVVDGVVQPMELAHLPYKKATFEDYVGLRGLQKYGKKKWRHFVANVVEHLIAAIQPDEVVLGGGNIHKLKELPPGCRAGDNSNAFLGGFRLWEKHRSARANRILSQARDRLRSHAEKPDLEDASKRQSPAPARRSKAPKPDRTRTKSRQLRKPSRRPA